MKQQKLAAALGAALALSYAVAGLAAEPDPNRYLFQHAPGNKAAKFTSNPTTTHHRFVRFSSAPTSERFAFRRNSQRKNTVRAITTAICRMRFKRPE